MKCQIHPKIKKNLKKNFFFQVLLNFWYLPLTPKMILKTIRKLFYDSETVKIFF